MYVISSCVRRGAVGSSSRLCVEQMSVRSVPTQIHLSIAVPFSTSQPPWSASDTYMGDDVLDARWSHTSGEKGKEREQIGSTDNPRLRDITSFPPPRTKQSSSTHRHHIFDIDDGLNDSTIERLKGSLRYMAPPTKRITILRDLQRRGYSGLSYAEKNMVFLLEGAIRSTRNSVAPIDAWQLYMLYLHLLQHRCMLAGRMLRTPSISGADQAPLPQVETSWAAFEVLLKWSWRMSDLDTFIVIARAAMESHAHKGQLRSLRFKREQANGESIINGNAEHEKQHQRFRSLVKGLLISLHARRGSKISRGEWREGESLLGSGFQEINTDFSIARVLQLRTALGVRKVEAQEETDKQDSEAPEEQDRYALQLSRTISGAQRFPWKSKPLTRALNRALENGSPVTGEQLATIVRGELQGQYGLFEDKEPDRDDMPDEWTAFEVTKNGVGSSDSKVVADDTRSHLYNEIVATLRPAANAQGDTRLRASVDDLHQGLPPVQGLNDGAEAGRVRIALSSWKEELLLQKEAKRGALSSFVQRGASSSTVEGRSASSDSSVRVPAWLMLAALHRKVEQGEPDTAARLVQLYIDHLTGASEQQRSEEARTMQQQHLLLQLLPINTPVWTISDADKPPPAPSLLNPILQARLMALDRRGCMDKMLGNVEDWCSGGEGLRAAIYARSGIERSVTAAVDTVKAQPPALRCLHPNEATVLLLLEAVRLCRAKDRAALGRAVLEESFTRWDPAAASRLSEAGPAIAHYRSVFLTMSPFLQIVRHCTSTQSAVELQKVLLLLYTWLQGLLTTNAASNPPPKEFTGQQYRRGWTPIDDPQASARPLYTKPAKRLIYAKAMPEELRQRAKLAALLNRAEDLGMLSQRDAALHRRILLRMRPMHSSRRLGKGIWLLQRRIADGTVDTPL